MSNPEYFDTDIDIDPIDPLLSDLDENQLSNSSNEEDSSFKFNESTLSAAPSSGSQTDPTENYNGDLESQKNRTTYILFILESQLPLDQNYQEYYDPGSSMIHTIVLPDDFDPAISGLDTDSMIFLCDAIDSIDFETTQVHIQFGFDLASDHIYDAVKFYGSISPFVSELPHRLDILKSQKLNHDLMFYKSKDRQQSIWECIDSTELSVEDDKLTVHLYEQLFAMSMSLHSKAKFRGLPFFSDSDLRIDRDNLLNIDSHSKLMAINIVVSWWNRTTTENSDVLMDIDGEGEEENDIIDEYRDRDNFHSAQCDLTKAAQDLMNLNLSESTRPGLSFVQTGLKQSDQYQLETEFSEEGISECFLDEDFIDEFPSFYELFFEVYTKGYTLCYDSFAKLVSVDMDEEYQISENQSILETRRLKVKKSVGNLLDSTTKLVNSDGPKFIRIQLFHSGNELLKRHDYDMAKAIETESFMGLIHRYYQYCNRYEKILTVNQMQCFKNTDLRKAICIKMAQRRMIFCSERHQDEERGRTRELTYEEAGSDLSSYSSRWRI